MALTTTYTFLMIKRNGTYEKLIDIKDYSDLGGHPNAQEYTTLSHAAAVYLPGIESNEAITCTANYTLDDYSALLALKGIETEFSIWFGGTVGADGLGVPAGDEGKFDFKGYLSVVVSGGGVDAIRDMQISIMKTTPVTLGE